MASQHTPGPWFLEELSSIKDGDGYILTEGSRVTVAHHGGGYSLGLPREEVLANARLIAAAPETAAERDRLERERDDFKSALELTTIHADTLKAVNAKLMEALEGAGEALELAMAACSMPTFTPASKADAESSGLWSALQDIGTAVAKAKEMTT